MSIGERIASLRTQQNISQNQLAKALGLSRQAVSKWEADKSSPDTLNLIKLAGILDTEVEYLATGNHLPKPPSPVVVNLVKRVEAEKIVERVIEKPVIRKVTRIQYRQDPVLLIIVGAIGMFIGIILGLLF